MACLPGSRLGPYEIVSPLGAGGMGEVYRAKDTNLNRDVAIKILPESFALDADRVARFKREAQVLASLNHPNIAAIYGIESNALVMELVEGEDLSEMIARNAGSKDPGHIRETVLPIAKQIADALEAAHELGIVHRDLKPQNIKVRADGTVKVLDFGLAKALDPTASSASADAMMNSPTMTARMTQMGMILGTAAYMSPEQARGRAVDRRADIWAFGVVLYEMLTGRRCFEGEDISITLASVLKEDVKWDTLPADLPAPLRRLLRRCLEKDPKKRLSSIGDARLELEENEPIADAAAAVFARPARGARAIRLAAVTSIWVITLIAAALFFHGTAPPSLPTSFALLPPLGASIQINVNQPDLGISHDGRRIVYSYGDQGSAIVMRRLDQFADTPMAGLGVQPRSPFFSPDDKWMGYFAGPPGASAGHLMKVLADGGPPVEIATVVGNLRGAAWGRDNTIVLASADRSSGLLRVSADSGTPEVLTKPLADEADHLWPAIMPDGKHVMFTISRPDASITGRFDLAALDLATKKWRVIKSGASYATFITTGHLLYATPQGVFAAPFDPAACAFRGDAVRVADDVAFKPATGAADVAVSDAGTLTYVTGAAGLTKRLAWVDRAAETPISAPTRAYNSVLLSPDGARAATLFIGDDGEQSLSVLDLARGTLTPVSPSGSSVASPVWSRDGKNLYYRGLNVSTQGIFRVSAGGAGVPELVVQPQRGESLAPASVTPDGRSLLVTRSAGNTQDLQIVNLEGKPEPKLLLAESGRLLSARVSPDNRWLAYASTVGGPGSVVFIRPYPNVNDDRRQVSTGAGGYPIWAENSRALFFDKDPNGNVFRVDVAPNGRLGTPVEVTPANSSNLQMRDVPTSSGRTLRIAPMLEGAKANQLRVVLNWFEVLKEKMAGGK